MAEEKTMYRGLKEEHIAMFKKNVRLMDLILHDDEIFFGIRGNSCNLYYRCASLGEVSFDSGISLSISNEYLDIAYQNMPGDHSEFQGQQLERFWEIAGKGGPVRKRIDGLSSGVIPRKKSRKPKATWEKVAQQELVRRRPSPSPA